MRKHLLALLLPLIILSGCATSHIHTVKIEESAHPYFSILTLVGYAQSDFSGIDSMTYEQHIRGRFTNLENHQYRTHLEKALKRTMGRAQARVISSSEVFKVNTDVSYREFLEKVAALNIDAILFVNQRSYWHTFTLAAPGNFLNRPEPNATFHTYLLTPHTLQPVWYAKSTTNGVYAGFDTLNNTYARQLVRNLYKDRLILLPRAVQPPISNSRAMR